MKSTKHCNVRYKPRAYIFALKRKIANIYISFNFTNIYLIALNNIDDAIAT